MIRRMIAVFALASLLTVATQADAAPVISFDPNTGHINPNLDQTIGWSFNVTRPITVTGVGWYDDGGDGLAMAHSVGIWAPNGSFLTGAVVPAGTVAPLDGQFRTQALLAAVTLPVGNGYIIGGQNFVNNPERAYYGSNQSIDPFLQFGNAAFINSSGLTRPTNFANPRTTGIYGPSFSTPPRLGAPQVPEPTSIALFTLVSVGGLVWHRRRTRAAA